MCSTSRFTLPNAPSQFKDKEYWDSVFSKWGSDAFEWYGEYSTLCPLLRKYVRQPDKILVVGCGNSQLSSDIYDDGYFNVVNIDTSEVIIKKMRSKNANKRSKMTWQTMDVTQMTFEDSDFSVIIDKGTLDALMPDNTEAVCNTVDRMFRETERVLRVGGRLIIVSLLQEHILKFVISWFGTEGWLVRFHRCDQPASGQQRSRLRERSRFPIFMVVCTKLKKVPGMKTIFELCKESKAERISDTSAIVTYVRNLQHTSLVHHYITTQKNLDNQSLELWVPNVPEPRYHFHIVDRSKACKIKFASFLVPQGRENEWLFNTSEGRHHLADLSGVRRLVVVHMTRSHQYDNIEAVEAELGPALMDIAPKDVTEKDDIPFLSLGEDLGKRTTVSKGHSELSGDYIVEDVEYDDSRIFRRLIFESNPNIIQSEAKLNRLMKKGKKKDVIDVNHLACKHHELMVTGLGLVYHHTKELEGRILIFGLGGGSLPMYIYSHFPRFSLEVVDIDPEVLKLAVSWFGFKQDERMKVRIEDGLDVISNYSKTGELFDYILLDVDSKVVDLGLSCPPKEFVTCEKLNEMKSLLKPNGVCVINFVCRSIMLKESLINDVICNVFDKIFGYEIPGEVNYLLYCFPSSEDLSKPELHHSFQKVTQTCKSEINIDLFLDNLKVVQ